MASLIGSHPLPSYWLHEAVALGDLKLVKTLLTDGNFPPNKPLQMPGHDQNSTQDGPLAVYLPLHVAILQRNTTVEKMLLSSGAKPELVTEGFREKHVAPEGRPAKTRKCHLVQILLEQNANVGGVADMHLGTSWLHEVVRHGMPGDLAKKLHKQGAPLDAGDGKGNTALHFSLEKDDRHMCRILLDLGANMNLYNKVGFTSFGVACMNGEVETVNYMITLGADVNGGSNKPLFLACKGLLVKWNYRQPESTSEQQAAWRNTWAAAKDTRNQYLEIARQLLSHGADPNEADADGNTPIMAAAESGFVEVIPELASADIYRATLKVLAAVEEQAADTNDTDDSSDQLTAEETAAVRAAVAAHPSPIDGVVDMAGRSKALLALPQKQLCRAAAATKVDLKSVMANVGPSLNKPNTSEAITPLVMASSWGYSAAVEALVKAGADPNLPSGEAKQPPIYIAAKLGHMEVLGKLVELGAEWPHGKKAAAEGKDVVQLLVENYKGGKALQPSMAIKLLAAAEKRGQQARQRKQQGVTVLDPDAEARKIAADQAFRELLLMDAGKQQNKGDSSAQATIAAVSSKKKKRKKKAKADSNAAKQAAEQERHKRGTDGSGSEENNDDSREDDIHLPRLQHNGTWLQEKEQPAAEASDTAANRSDQDTAGSSKPNGSAQQQQAGSNGSNILNDAMINMAAFKCRSDGDIALDSAVNSPTAASADGNDDSTWQPLFVFGTGAGPQHKAAHKAMRKSSRQAAAGSKAGDASSSSSNSGAQGSSSGKGATQGTQPGSTEPGMIEALEMCMQARQRVDDYIAKQERHKAAAVEEQAAGDASQKAAAAGDASQKAAAAGDASQKAAAASDAKNNASRIACEAKAQAGSNSAGTGPAAKPQVVGASAVQLARHSIAADPAVDASDSASTSSGVAANAQQATSSTNDITLENSNSSSSSNNSQAQSVTGSAAAVAAAMAANGLRATKATRPQPQQAAAQAAAGNVYTYNSSDLPVGMSAAAAAASKAMEAIFGRGAAAGNTAGAAAAGTSVKVQREGKQTSDANRQLFANEVASKGNSSSASYSSGASACAKIAAAATTAATAGRQPASALQQQPAAKHTYEEQHLVPADVGYEKQTSKRSQKLAATASRAAAVAVAGILSQVHVQAQPKPVPRSISDGSISGGSSRIHHTAVSLAAGPGGSSSSTSDNQHHGALNPLAAPFTPPYAVETSTASATTSQLGATPVTSPKAAAAACSASRHSGAPAFAAKFATAGQFSSGQHLPGPQAVNAISAAGDGNAASMAAGPAAEALHAAVPAAADSSADRLARMLPPHLLWRAGINSGDTASKPEAATPSSPVEGTGSMTAAAGAAESRLGAGWTISNPDSNIGVAPGSFLQQQQQPSQGAPATGAWLPPHPAYAPHQQPQQQQQKAGMSASMASAPAAAGITPTSAAQYSAPSVMISLQQPQQVLQQSAPVGHIPTLMQLPLPAVTAAATATVGPPFSDDAIESVVLQPALAPAAFYSQSAQQQQPQQVQQVQYTYMQVPTATGLQPMLIALPTGALPAAALPTGAPCAAAAASPGVVYHQGQPLAMTATADGRAVLTAVDVDVHQAVPPTYAPAATPAAAVQWPGDMPANAAAPPGQPYALPPVSVPPTSLPSPAATPPPAAAYQPSWQQQWQQQQAPVAPVPGSAPPAAASRPLSASGPLSAGCVGGTSGGQLPAHMAMLLQRATAGRQQQHSQHQHQQTTGPSVGNHSYGPPPPTMSAATTSASAPSSSNSAASSALTAAANKDDAVAAAELQKLKEAHETMTCCVVCMDAPRSVLLLPCKHLALCEECSQQLQETAGVHRRHSECPVCRVPVAQFIAGVYMT